MKKKQPPKRMITREGCDISPYELEVKLSDLQVLVNQWLAAYGPEARLDWDANFYHAYDHNPSPRFTIQISEEETDKEYADRLDKEEKQRQEIENREKAEFDRLTKKFKK